MVRTGTHVVQDLQPTTQVVAGSRFCPIGIQSAVSVLQGLHEQPDSAKPNVTSTKDPPDGGGAVGDGGGGGGGAPAPTPVATTPTALNSPSASQAVKAADALLSFAVTDAVFAVGTAPSKAKVNATRPKAPTKLSNSRVRRASQAGDAPSVSPQAKPANARRNEGSSPPAARNSPVPSTSGTTSCQKKSGNNRRGKGRKKGIVSPGNTEQPAAEKPNVWATARETLLGERKHTEPDYEDEITFAEAYKICRKDYRIMPDGYQREPTKEEIQAEVLWRQRKIFLAQEPKFFAEIYPLKVRLTLRQHHHDKMLYTAFVQMPPQLKWPAETARYHFFESLVQLNQPGADAKDRANAVQLFKDVHVFTLSEDGKLVALRFIRPELRDKWVNATFKFPFGTIKLRASASFEQEDKRSGLDDQAVKQLFPLHLLGRSNLPITTVNDIAEALGGGLPILEVAAIPAIGDRTLDTHVWSITFNSFDAPQGIENVRCVTVKQGDFTFTMGVHQPRTATRHPCSVCLDIGHFRNKCTNHDKASEMREKFERVIEIPPTSKYELEPPANDEVEHVAQVSRLYAAVAPQLAPPQLQAAAGTHDEAADSPATKAAASGVAGSTSKQPKQSTKRKQQSDQVRALAKALAKAKERKAAECKEALSKLKENYGARAENTAPPRKTKAGRTAITSKPDQAQRWISVPGACEVQTLVVGDKRTRAQLDPPQAIFDSDPSNEATREPVTRQPRSSVAHAAVERKRPDAPRTKIQWEALGGELPPVQRPRLGQLTMTPFFQRLPARDPGDSTTTDNAEDPISGPVTSAEIEEVGVRAAARDVVQFTAVLDKIKARQVQTCADGRCLYHALIAAISRTCGDAVNVTDSIEIKRAAELMRDLNSLLAEDLVAMLVNGSLQLVELCSRYLDRPVQSDSVQSLTEYFKTAAALTGPSVSRQFWGGEAEIIAFVAWKLEPVYSLDIWPNGHTFVQRYTPVDYQLADKSVASRVVRQAISVQRFYAHIAIYRRHKVVPLMLALHHSFEKTEHQAHYTALRISDAEYREFAGSIRKQDSMQARLPRVQAEIAALEEEATPTQHDSEPTQYSSGGCSEYLPSTTSSVTGSEGGTASLLESATPDKAAPHGGDIAQHAHTGGMTGHADHDAQGNPDAQDPQDDQDDQADDDHDMGAPAGGNGIAPQGTTNTEMVIDLTTPPEALPKPGPAQAATSAVLGEPQRLHDFDLSSICSTPTDPSLSYDNYEPRASKATSAPLTPGEETKPLHHLSEGTHKSPDATRLLRKAQTANRTAYKTWKKRQMKKNPAMYRLVAQVADPGEATEALRDRPGALKGLLNAMPFPEVHLLTTDDATLLRAGKHAIIIARLQLLHRVGKAVQAEKAAFCSEWAAAIHAASTIEAKWTLIHDPARWKRLTTLATQLLFDCPIGRNPDSSRPSGVA